MKKALLLLGTFLPSSLRLFLWRRMGFRVGVGCRVAPFSIVVADHIEIEHGAVIETLCLIFSPRKLVLGERCRIASMNRMIGFGEILLGRQCFIAFGNLIDATARFVLGARSQLGPRGTYYTHGATCLLFNAGYPTRVGDIVIGEDVWLGMCTIVYPKVKIGSRILGFAGLVITGDVEGGQLLFPPGNSYKTLPIKRVVLLPGGGEKQKREALDSKLRALANAHPGSRIEETERVWTLSLPGSRRVILLREGDLAGLKDLFPGRTVVWKLHGAETSPPVPFFCFEDLTVYGKWTPFAEDIAAFLCSATGVHFFFHQR